MDYLFESVEQHSRRLTEACKRVRAQSVELSKRATELRKQSDAILTPHTDEKTDAPRRATLRR